METEIYEKLKNKYPEPLPGFEKIVLSQLRQRAKKIFNYLEDRQNRLNVKCENCGEKYADSRYVEIVLHELSYGKTETDEHCFCSEKCSCGVSDWSFFCGTCDQRFRNDDLADSSAGILLCRTCHADGMLENGMLYDEIGNHEDYILKALKWKSVNSQFKLIGVLHEQDIFKKLKMLGLDDGEFLLIPVRNKNRDKYKFYIKEDILEKKKTDLEFAIKITLLVLEAKKKSYIVKN